MRSNEPYDMWSEVDQIFDLGQHLINFWSHMIKAQSLSSSLLAGSLDSDFIPD